DSHPRASRCAHGATQNGEVGARNPCRTLICYSHRNERNRKSGSSSQRPLGFSSPAYAAPLTPSPSTWAKLEALIVLEKRSVLCRLVRDGSVINEFRSPPVNGRSCGGNGAAGSSR